MHQNETDNRHAVDAARLAKWLAANLPGFAGPLRIEMLKGGQSNPTYKLITPGRTYVMRAKPGPAAKLLPSAHAIDREYRVMHALRETDVPVAGMCVLCEDESVIGRAFYVMAFERGASCGSNRCQTLIVGSVGPSTTR